MGSGRMGEEREEREGRKWSVFGVGGGVPSGVLDTGMTSPFDYF